MWTISYKGFFIHGYCDKDECSIGGGHLTNVKRKSLHAAKMAITSHLKSRKT